MDELFKDFHGREQALRGVTRWSIKSLMFYRPNLWTHSKHVYWLLKDSVPAIQKVFPNVHIDRMLILALVHDDTEIIMGDVQAGNKSKMTEAQLAQILETEKMAIDEIAKRFPRNIGAFDYKELLNEVLKKDTVESQLMNYADKYDGFGEALQEIYGGNATFGPRIFNEYGEILAPGEYYIEWFKKRETIMPLIKPIFDAPGTMFELPPHTDFEKISKESKPHTSESIQLETGYRPYDLWRGIILKYADKEEVENLYTQKEFA